MPIQLHIILVVILTGYFIFRFVKNRNIYEILFIIWVPSTLLQYVSDDPTFLRALGVSQIVLFILVVFFMFRRRKSSGRKTAQILADYATGDLDKVMEKRTSADGVTGKRPSADEVAQLKEAQHELELARENLERIMRVIESGEQAATEPEAEQPETPDKSSS